MVGGLNLTQERLDSYGISHFNSEHREMTFFREKSFIPMYTNPINTLFPNLE